jgi:hypothetical protein
LILGVSLRAVRATPDEGVRGYMNLLGLTRGSDCGDKVGGNRAFLILGEVSG